MGIALGEVVKCLYKGCRKEFVLEKIDFNEETAWVKCPHCGCKYDTTLYALWGKIGINNCEEDISGNKKAD
jgi:hypothetical protein